MTVWEELAPSELAAVLGIRTGTVAVRLHRARRRFKAALATEDVPQTTPVEVSR